MATYWTLQEEVVWNEAVKIGYLEGKQEYAMYPAEYIWMMAQMKQRLENYNDKYPIWLWIKKPDMRSASHFKSYTRCVRLTIDLEEENVLVSDFEDWHSVLNNGFNADNEQEYDDFYEGKLKITKEESWERIFELERIQDPLWSGVRDWLQGVTGRIDINKVKKVEHFISRKQVEF
ncbi:DUF3841 domain-containing protein [Paenibacillus sp. HWE-109]|uniref:DUF3841 domain-containing protein n=1 Tax=Paenibacillus sp. HWE-109 TaxID=1306526 RepID=UPI001EDED212|nr:DUF3841 domain-containing protein [Paenibacillus sp. HWE-109]UKS27356.1 DUF3841 domain-containing protein [Paenibacillus sp. HWE-109]